MSALRVEKAAADIRYKDDKRALPKYGLVILIGVDELAVRFHAWQLMAHSSVFREMIGNDAGEIIISMPDADSDDLTVLRRHFKGHYEWGCQRADFENILLALELCERYDMTPVGRALLESAIEAEVLVLAEHTPEAFIWASRYDSIELAIKIFVMAPQLHHLPEAAFPGTTNFDRDAAAKVQSTWVWAIKEAEAEVHMREADLTDPGIWKSFAGAFVKHLL